MRKTTEVHELLVKKNVVSETNLCITQLPLTVIIVYRNLESINKAHTERYYFIFHVNNRCSNILKIANFIMPETHQLNIVIILIIYSPYLLKDVVKL